MLPRPVLIYDGDCGFCRRWAEGWRTLTGAAVEYITGAQARARFPGIPPEHLAQAVQLVTTHGQVLSGAAAVFRALACGGHRWLWRLYRRAPGFAFAAERLYRAVATHRALAGRLDKRWLGTEPRPRLRFGLMRALASSYLAVPAGVAIGAGVWRRSRGRRRRPPSTVGARWLFLRLLGGVYFAAFRSAHVQLRGLVGDRGILPARQYFALVRRAESRPYLSAPTLLWLDPSDRGLLRLSRLGMGLAALLFFDVAPIPVLVGLWALYLSLVTGGQTFLSYQWDALLLETGILATLYAPPGTLPRRRQAPPTRAATWLLRFLHFRVMFSSGVAKRVSGDPTWRQARALEYHYETQPLPTRLSYEVHQLPPRFHRASVYVVWLAEIVAPLLGLTMRRMRAVAALSTIVFQALIAATGNYGFFNLLTAALALPLLDDEQLPTSLRRLAPRPSRRRRRGRTARLLLPATVGLTALGAVPLAHSCGLTWPWPSGLLRFHERLAPFRSVNPYGLFAAMTTMRPELIIEGSDDSVAWRAYELAWKPGSPTRRPRFAFLHLPRLDWQMWFAALHPSSQQHWLFPFLARLLEGSPEVLALLSHNPFPERPPKYVRVGVYRYRFSHKRERARTGAWWRREFMYELVPAAALPKPAVDERAPERARP